MLYHVCVCVCAQSCPTLCHPMEPVRLLWDHGIFQTRILEWTAISYSRRSSQPGDRTYVCCVCVTAGGFSYHFTNFEALYHGYLDINTWHQLYMSTYCWRVTRFAWCFWKNIFKTFQDFVYPHLACLHCSSHVLLLVGNKMLMIKLLEGKIREWTRGQGNTMVCD